MGHRNKYRCWFLRFRYQTVHKTILGLTDEDVCDAVINKSEDMNYIWNTYKLKLASWTCETSVINLILAIFVL